jgi:hypothetical protein
MAAVAWIELHHLTTHPPRWLLVLGGASTLLGCVAFWRLRNAPPGSAKRAVLLRAGAVPIFSGLAVASIATAQSTPFLIFFSLWVGAVVLSQVLGSRAKKQRAN